MQCPWALLIGDSRKCIRSAFDVIENCEGVMESCPLGQDFISYNPDLPMYISEIYPAISGEGGSQGTVCTIVRVTGCNLRCNYCDTTYAYEGGDCVATKDVLSAILKFGIRTVLFTGGEPLLDSAVASNFLQALFENEIKGYVETNGATDIRYAASLATIVMDIKCPSSGMHDRTLWDNLRYLKIDDEIKFVVADWDDYEYTIRVMEEHDLEGRNVFISPAWTEDRQYFRDLADRMVADRSSARLSIQQHKEIWGATKRGV